MRDYAWGSRTHIPRLLGDEPSDAPAAELWIGAHEQDPSRLPDRTTLDAAIAADPVAALGPEVAATYAGRLPFLAKFLAAGAPLSLQVHPTRADARAGFAREQATGLPLDDPRRSYTDTSPKPEMLLALTRFEGMAGFRPVERSASLLRELGLPWLEEMADDLVSGAPPDALRRVVTTALATPEALRAGRLADLADACRATQERLARPPSRSRPPTLPPEALEREQLRVCALTADLIARYPADAGVVVTLLLNHVVLAPGEAIFLDAGVVHAYTSGFGLEVMAASDNVLRAGLTPKHVDIPELLAITDFRPAEAPLLAPSTPHAGLAEYLPAVPDFAVLVADADPPQNADLPASGPRLVIALDGEVEVRAGRATASLTAGRAAWIPHADGPLAVAGRGRYAVVSVPDPVRPPAAGPTVA